MGPCSPPPSTQEIWGAGEPGLSPPEVPGAVLLAASLLPMAGAVFRAPTRSSSCLHPGWPWLCPPQLAVVCPPRVPTLSRRG